MSAEFRRLREIDFLRGVAILLVLFRHCYLFDFTVNMGWIGVDLFFVLSGFLVSGLLFREYKKHGDIKPSTFLIRRGFKIYPIYYLMYAVYLIPLYLSHTISTGKLLADLTFIQNYISGWGYAFEASWSLAVEEHFYFGLALILWLSLKHKKLTLQADTRATGFSQLEKVILGLMVFCLFLRIASNLAFPDEQARNFTMTHLRIDSLLAGVLISYLYQFRKNRLIYLIENHKMMAISLVIAGLFWTPFSNPVHSFFIKTLGFTLLYVAFGIILVYFITCKDINRRLDSLFSAPVVNLISKIGFCSYSIYIVHPFINILFIDYLMKYMHLNQYVLFVVTSAVSLSLGMLMTNTLEDYFLGIRNKYYPNRSSPVLV
ncbi:acyltransferase family protein [Fibrella arboris]|uniref:acyltransferase family protein n=1 Tax=Fibrella arboris TaxID=3242486 RepID=UPI003522BDC6